MKHSSAGHFLWFTFHLFPHEFKKAKRGDWKQLKIFLFKTKSVELFADCYVFTRTKDLQTRRIKTKQIQHFCFREDLKAWIKQIFKINPFLFAGGQEHPEQVQRGGGEEIAHSGGAGIRLCIWNHFQLRRICICMYLHVFACTSRCIWNHFELSRTCIGS